MDDGGNERRGDNRATTLGAAPEALSQLLAELARAPEEVPSAEIALVPGQRVGRYEIRREIGRGGFGVVYEAHDPELSRAVALKTLRRGRKVREHDEGWIRQEAEAVARLDHPSIVTVFDVGSCAAGPYLVEELLHGETLAERIAKGPLPPEEALRVAEEMARGLAHAHHRGVLHRDLKPANVFLTDDGRVKLLDFGLAHLLGREGSSGGGTPAYMAPEQRRGEAVDERADVYAAAVVLAETVTGKRPTPPETAGAAATPPALRGVPRAMARAVGSALSPDPAARPRDGRAWLELLGSVRRALARPRTVRRILALGGIFLVLGFVVAAIATWRWGRAVPIGRPTVAIADAVNETGEQDLGQFSELLFIALEQSARLRVIPRGRLFDLARQIGRGAVARIEEPLAREVAVKGAADVLLVPVIRAVQGTYAVDLRAVDPATSDDRFTLRERGSGDRGILEIADRLAGGIRHHLGAEPGGDTAPPRRVETITTGNRKSWDLLFQARDRLYHGGSWKEVRELLDAALREDPEFGLGHYMYAWVAVVANPGSPRAMALAREHLAAAETRASPLPDKEWATLRAMRACLDGDHDASARLLTQVAESYPLDKEAQLLAAFQWGDAGAPEKGIPFYERALKLDPTFTQAGAGLLSLYVALGVTEARLDAIRSIVNGFRALPLNGGPVMALAALAYLAAGRERESRETIELALEPPEESWLNTFNVSWLLARERGDEAERLVEEALSDPRLGPHDRKWMLEWAVDIRAAQGRIREARRAEERRLALVREDPRLGGGRWVNPRQARLLAVAIQAPDAVRAATGDIDGLVRDPELRLGVVHDAAFDLALAGDVQGGGRLAADLLARLGDRWKEVSGWYGSGYQMEDYRKVEALAALGRGASDEAERALLALARHPLLYQRFGASFLLGEIARTRGDCATAVGWLEQARGLPDDLFTMRGRQWALPGMLHALATCHEKLGDIAKARERNDELLRRWSRADPDVPMLVEAKAMQARLAAATPARK